MDGRRDEFECSKKKMMMVEMKEGRPKKNTTTATAATASIANKEANSTTPMGQVNVGCRSIIGMDISPMAGQGDDGKILGSLSNEYGSYDK